MTAPFSVDPAALAGTGRSVGGEGDAIASAVGSLDSSLSGAGALFGHDAAGLVFGQSYTASGNAVLQAAASAVNATRRVGFGVQTSAVNYGHANASSTVGGGAAPVEVPSAPTQFSAPEMPPPLGGGIAAPWGWSLVEAFVGDVWPDGDPAKMRAAAGAWRSFGTTVGGLAGEVTATGFGLGAQQIPEAGPMAHAMGQIEAGLAKVAAEAQAVATAVDGFASAVDSTQDAVRGLLHELSPSGILDAIGGIFTGHDPMDEVRKIAREIKTVLDNMKREADASGQLFRQGINSLDSATNSLETWANKEFTSVFGQDVGGALSFGFNAAVEQSEGALKFVAVTVQGLGQLDPTRFAYDPKGAAETWGKAAEGLSTMLNPATLIQKVVTDPSGSLDTVKGMVDWKDVEDGHPFRALGYNEAQIATAFIPGVGEAEPAIDGASVVGRTASAEERATAGAARDGVPGLTGATSASETITGQASHVASELDGVKVPESAPAGAAPGESVPTGRAPVDTAPAPTETPSSRPPVDTLPRAEAPASTPHEAGPAPRGPEGSSPPAAESTAPVGPHDAEPVPVHADSSPPHASEPAPSAAAPGDASAPAGGGSREPSLPTDESAPTKPAPEHIDDPTRAAVGPPSEHGDARPQWSNDGQGNAPDTGHQESPASPHTHDGHDHDALPVDDGVGPDGRVKFSGHGSYSLRDGDIMIPEGSSVTVYAEHGSRITDALGNLIETGGDTSNVYSKTYYPGDAMPNYTLHPPDGLDIQGSPWIVQSPLRLSEILGENMGDIDFAACLYDMASPTDLVYDLQGVWDDSQGQFAHVYESSDPPSSWDFDASDENESGFGTDSQSYYNVEQDVYTEPPDWESGGTDNDDW